MRGKRYDRKQDEEDNVITEITMRRLHEENYKYFDELQLQKHFNYKNINMYAIIISILSSIGAFLWHK